MTGAVEVMVSEQDLLDAYRLHLIRVSLKRTGALVAATICLAVILGLLDHYFPKDSSLIDFLVGLLCVMASLLIALHLVLRWYTPHMARKHYAQHRDVHQPFQYHWDATHFAIMQGENRWQRAWNHFVGWRADEKMLMLYVTDHQFHIIPTAPATRDAIADIRHQLVAHAIPEKK